MGFLEHLNHIDQESIKAMLEPILSNSFFDVFALFSFV